MIVVSFISDRKTWKGSYRHALVNTGLADDSIFKTLKPF